MQFRLTNPIPFRLRTFPISHTFFLEIRIQRLPPKNIYVLLWSQVGFLGHKFIYIHMHINLFWEIFYPNSGGVVYGEKLKIQI